MIKSNVMKPVKHKPTMSPLQCDHCRKIWYGMFCASNARIVPQGRMLCVNCWGALDNHLYNHQEYEAIADHTGEDTDEWKKGYPLFFGAAAQWIEDPKQDPRPRKNPYASRVPKWVRIAIEAGKMVPNDEYIYTVTTCGDNLVKVDKTLDRSELKPGSGKVY